jgi:hypothetical protein
LICCSFFAFFHDCFFAQGTRIAVRTIRQSWGTQLNVWDGVSVLDSRMTSSNKQTPAPGGSWDTIFLVSSSNYMLIEADQQAKAYNQGKRFAYNTFNCFFLNASSLGFAIQYRFVSHAETWSKSQSSKPRFVASSSSSQEQNIIGPGVVAQLSEWPYFSSLFYVCPQGAEALVAGTAITININQVSLECCSLFFQVTYAAD